MHTRALHSLAGPCTLVCTAGTPCLHISVRHVIQKCAACNTFETWEQCCFSLSCS